MNNILFYDSLNDGEDISLTAQYRVTISSSGQVGFVPGLKWVTSCKVDLRYFPYDRQQCNITLVNWSYGTSLRFMALEPSLLLYEENDSWELDNVTTGDGFMMPEISGVPVVYLTVSIRRKPQYYFMNVLIPCILTSLLSITVFILPVESEEKISLAITVSLSYTVLLLMISEITPASGISMPYLSEYLIKAI